MSDIMRPALLIALVPLVVASCAFSQSKFEDKCAQTAHMQVYSSAYIVEETGDVLGYELAIKRSSDSSVDGLLYVYEGAPNDNGIPLSGHISGKRLAFEGNWVEHLVEYPSKKEIVQTHFVKVSGTLDSASFRGRMKIEGMEDARDLRLKRLQQIWSCRRADHKKP